MYFGPDVDTENIVQELNETTCKDRGFKVNKLHSRKSSGTLVIGCIRGRKFRQTKRSNNDAKLHTTLPTCTESLCPFPLPIYSDTTNDRFVC